MKRSTENRSLHHVGATRYMSKWIAAVMLLLSIVSSWIGGSGNKVNAFCLQPAPISSSWSTQKVNHRRLLSHLHMTSSKSLNNKQAALRQKMEQAKRQNEKESEASKSLSDEEIRQRNDRLRFEELLKKGAAAISSADGGEYLSRRQEEEEIDAVRAGKDLLFAGDAAPTDCFEELVSIKSENAIGVTGKQRLVPWLHKNAARHEDYVVVLGHPERVCLAVRCDVPRHCDVFANVTVGCPCRRVAPARIFFSFDGMFSSVLV